MKSCVIRVSPRMRGETFDAVCRMAEKKYGGGLSFTRVDDETLLGGFVLERDGEISDLSFSSQLEAVKKQILG